MEGKLSKLEAQLCTMEDRSAVVVSQAMITGPSIVHKDHTLDLVLVNGIDNVKTLNVKH